MGRATPTPALSTIRIGFAANLGDVAFLQEHEAPGHGQQCRHIGSDEIFIDAEADNHRAARAREHDALGIGLRNGRERVRAVQFRNGFAHRLVQPGRFRQMMVNAVRDDLGVGLRTEGVAEFGETGAQRLVILDDAVVHDGNAVARHMRMSILRGRNPVSGPPGMRDADVPRDGGRLESLREDIDLADRAQPG